MNAQHTAEIDARVRAYPDPAPGESYEHWRRKFNEYVTARLRSVTPPEVGHGATD